MLYLFVGLKIPILLAGWIVWWAVKQAPDPAEDAGGDRAPVAPSPSAAEAAACAPPRAARGACPVTAVARAPRDRPRPRAGGRHARR